MTTRDAMLAELDRFADRVIAENRPMTVAERRRHHEITATLGLPSARPPAKSKGAQAGAHALGVAGQERWGNIWQAAAALGASISFLSRASVLAASSSGRTTGYVDEVFSEQPRIVLSLGLTWRESSLTLAHEIAHIVSARAGLGWGEGECEDYARGFVSEGWS